MSEEDSYEPWVSEEISAFMRCNYCEGLAHRKNLLTGRWHPKWEYIRDDFGKRIPIYAEKRNEDFENAPRRIIGYHRRQVDIILDHEGNPIPERRHIWCCGTDWCPYFKVPFKEARRHQNKEPSP